MAVGTIGSMISNLTRTQVQIRDGRLKRIPIERELIRIAIQCSPPRAENA